MLPTEWKSLEPWEFAAWVEGRLIYLESRSRDKIDIMFVIRWAAGFIVQAWSKKTIRVERFLKLPTDEKSNEPLLDEEDFNAIAKKFEDSANNR